VLDPDLVFHADNIAFIRLALTALAILCTRRGPVVILPVHQLRSALITNEIISNGYLDTHNLN